MKEFEEIIDSDNVICPYCDHSYEPELESFSEDERIEVCDSCNMKFHHVDEISYSCITRPDCALNGKEHIFISFKFRDGSYRYFCKVCNEIKTRSIELQK
jgi:predicted RNA-binding Zn-ribbon protein involved in translation (DUF1610 family)